MRFLLVALLCALSYAQTVSELTCNDDNSCLQSRDGWDIDEFCGLYDISLCDDIDWGDDYSECCRLFCDICGSSEFTSAQAWTGGTTEIPSLNLPMGLITASTLHPTTIPTTDQAAPSSSEPIILEVPTSSCGTWGVSVICTGCRCDMNYVINSRVHSFEVCLSKATEENVQYFAYRENGDDSRCSIPHQDAYQACIVNPEVDLIQTTWSIYSTRCVMPTFNPTAQPTEIPTIESCEDSNPLCSSLIQENCLIEIFYTSCPCRCITNSPSSVPTLSPSSFPTSSPITTASPTLMPSICIDDNDLCSLVLFSECSMEVVFSECRCHCLDIGNTNEPSILPVSSAPSLTPSIIPSQIPSIAEDCANEDATPCGNLRHGPKFY